MKSVIRLFLIGLIGMISLTSCTAEMEQTTTQTKQTNFHNQNLTAKDTIACEKEEYCAQDAVKYYIEVDKDQQAASRCHVFSIHAGSNGTYYGTVACSSGNTYAFVYDHGDVRLVLFDGPGVR